MGKDIAIGEGFGGGVFGFFLWDTISHIGFFLINKYTYVINDKGHNLNNLSIRNNQKGFFFISYFSREEFF